MKTVTTLPNLPYMCTQDSETQLWNSLSRKYSQNKYINKGEESITGFEVVLSTCCRYFKELNTKFLLMQK